MREMIISELTQALHELARGFAHFLPRLIVMLILAFLGWVIAYAVKVVLRSILGLIKFDKLSENAGASQLLTKADLPSATEVLSRFVFWVAWLGFILLGVSVLGILGLQEQITKFFLFLPRLFVALFIVFVGLLAATFFSRAALLSGVNAQLPSPRLISWAVRTMIILFVVSMAFEEIGVGSRTVIVAFTLTFGSLMLGLALAFGLGGKDLARKYLERRFAREQAPGEENRERE